MNMSENSQHPTDKLSSADVRQRSLWQGVADFFFGYDFFISYAHADGLAYASSLAEKLQELNFECFLDSQDYAKGDNWKVVGRRALKKTTRLILIASPRALQSEPVLREVRIYSRRGKHVIPIDFEGTLPLQQAKEGLLHYVDPDVIRILEKRDRLPIGPSPHVVEEICQSFKLRTQSQRRARWMFRATVLFLVLAVMALVFGVFAEINRRRAVQRLVVSRATALAAEAAAVRSESPRRSLLLAVEAVKTTRDYEGHIPLCAGQRMLPVAYESLIGSVAWSGGQPLGGHAGPLTAMEVSQEGRWLISASLDGRVLLWDLHSIDDTSLVPQKPAIELSGHSTAVHAVTFLPLAAHQPGKPRLATGDAQGEIRLWSPAEEGKTESWQTVHEMRGPTSPVTSLSFSPNGRWLAAGSLDTVKSVCVWDLSDKEPTKVHSKFAVEGEFRHGAVLARFAPPNNNLLITANPDWIFDIWALPPEARIWQKALQLPYQRVGLPPELTPLRARRGLAMGANGELLVYGRHMLDAVVQGDVQIEFAGSKRLSYRKASHYKLKGHIGAVNGVAIVDRSVWCCGEDGNLTVWQLAEDGNSFPLQGTLRGHDGSIEDVAVHPTAKLLATASEDGTVRIWDVQRTVDAARESMVVLRGHDGVVRHVAFGGNNHDMLISGGDDGGLRLWDATDAKPTPSPILSVHPHYSDNPILAISLGSSQKRLATARRDSRSAVWDVTSTGLAPSERTFPDPLYNGAVIDVSLSWDEEWLLAVDGSPVVQLVNLGSPQSLGFESQFLELADGEKGTAVAWEYGDQRIVVGTNDGKIHIWDLPETWRQELPQDFSAGRVIEGHSGAVTCLAIPSSKPYFLSAGADSKVSVRSLEEDDLGQELNQLVGHEGRVNAVVLGRHARHESEEQLVVTVGEDRTAIVWKMPPNGEPRQEFRLKGHTGPVRCAAVRDDDRLLATGSTDRAIRLWDLDSDEPEANSIVLRGHGDDVNGATFHGTYLTTAGADGKLLTWQLDVEVLLQQAEHIAGRSLTPDERRRYLLDAASR
jgi:WD40 repeat protein